MGVTALTYLFIGFGGILGALLRFLLGKYISGKVSGFPLGTLVINVTGSFALSLLFFYFHGGQALNENVYLALTTGVMGAYTTFSTFTYETLQLAQEGRAATASAYLGGNVFLGIIGLLLGKLVANMI